MYCVDLIEDCCADRLTWNATSAALFLYGNYMYTVLNVEAISKEFGVK